MSRGTPSRIRFDSIFWFITSLLPTSNKKSSKINLHDSKLMTYAHGKQLPKLRLRIPCTVLPLMVWNSNGNWNYSNISFIECGPVRLPTEFKISSLCLHNLSRECPQLHHCETNSFDNEIIPVHWIRNWCVTMLFGYTSMYY